MQPATTTVRGARFSILNVSATTSPHAPARARAFYGPPSFVDAVLAAQDGRVQPPPPQSEWGEALPHSRARARAFYGRRRVKAAF